jgi:hypothetical protein
MHKPGISLDRARSIDTLANSQSRINSLVGYCADGGRGPGGAKTAEEYENG